MGFIAKGDRVILRPGSGSINGDYIYKKMISTGSFIDCTWGEVIPDFDTPVSNSTWTTYGAYKYLPIGVVRNIYGEEHSFNRNVRFDSSVRFSNTVTPANTDISDIIYLTALVRGSLTDDVSTISQRVIDEFSTGVYSYVLAIGKMNRDIDDYRAINIDVNSIKTFAGSAISTKDYTLPTSEAVYLINIALGTLASMSSISSLSVDVYRQVFVEFLGDNYVTPGSVGKTEINPDYKAEKAINNYIMEIDDDHIVSNTLIISPDYATELVNNSVYYLNINTSSSFDHISLGHYDMESEAYVATGTSYSCTISGTVANKVCIAVMLEDTFTIKALL